MNHRLSFVKTNLSFPKFGLIRKCPTKIQQISFFGVFGIAFDLVGSGKTCQFSKSHVFQVGHFIYKNKKLNQKFHFS